MKTLALSLLVLLSGCYMSHELPDGTAGTPATVAVAACFTGLRWELPCVAPHSGEGCDTPPMPVTTSVTCDGDPGAIYDVTLRFRGVVEQRTYIGGTAHGYWYTGADAPSRVDPFNVYSLDISSPPQHYDLNAGTSDINYCFPIDYTETVQIAADATVTLTADDIESTSINNHDEAGVPIVVDGIPPAPAAYDGQFIQLDVVSVTAR